MGDYDSIPGVRYSHLKYLYVSALHYRNAVEGKRKQTSAMSLGTAVHAATLEPERFKRDFLVFPGAVRRGKEWEAWRDAHADAVNITAKEQALALQIATSVRSHKDAAPLLVEGLAEEVVTWTDPPTGIPCKGRLDWVTRNTVVGLKTARSISMRAFGRQAMDLLYPLQWAMYADAVAAKIGRQPAMVEIVVENREPYDVAVYRIEDDVLNIGRALFRELMEKLQRCRATDKWPGIGDEVRALQLPDWAQTLAGMDPKLEIEGEEW